MLESGDAEATPMDKAGKRARGRYTLANRLSLALGAVIFLAIIATTATVTWNGFLREASREFGMLESTAKIFATSVSEPVARGDSQAAQQALTAIGRLDRMRYAEITTPDGNSFARMGFNNYLVASQGRKGARDALGLLFEDQAWAGWKIVQGGVHVGDIYLLADVSPIRAGLFRSLGANFLMAVTLALIAIALSRRVIGRLMQPLDSLSATMRRFSSGAPEALSLPSNTTAEIAALADSFRKMTADIIERDEQLLENQQMLERRVADRTRDLRSARDEAQTANEAKSEFLATISHEIRTPMNGMMVMAELLSTSSLPVTQKHYANVILKSGKGLLSIINDILDYSKIEAGSLVIEKAELDPAAIAGEVMTLFSQQAETKGLDFACMVDPEVPAIISGDPVRLTQILSNLVGNAIKFTDQGEVFIKLSWSGGLNTGILQVKIADTGIGIHAGRLDSVFERFSQADQSTTRRYGGTGLGLPICKRLVEAMDGEIAVRSEPGRGSDFVFRIPAEVISPAPAVPDPAGRRALLVVEIGATYQVLRAAFEAAGILVEHRDPERLADGAEETGHPALDLSDFDLVLITPALAEQVDMQDGDGQVIVIAGIGDPAAQALLDSGKAQAHLATPVSTSSVNSLLAGDAYSALIGEYASRFPATREDYPEHAGLSVLVADDNPVNREVIVQALKRFSIDPVVVDNGLEAVAAKRNESFDIVFMDCSMPDMDGFDATRAIRGYELESGQKRSQVVALTAHLANLVRERAMEAGMDDIVVKPFSLDSLAAAIRRAVNGESGLLLVADEPYQDQSASPDRDDENTSFQEHRARPDADHAACNVESHGDGGLPFDREQLRNLKSIMGSGFDAGFARLLELYREMAPLALERIDEAARQGDRNELASAAHALRSMANGLALARLAGHCAYIEERAANMDDQEMKTQLASLDALFNSNWKQIWSNDLGAAARDREDGLHEPPFAEAEVA